MKKLLTLLMALVMVFALATPAMAWVGWDAPETADPEDEVWNEFDLTGVRLEYIASSSATFSWVKSYYAEYNPANKGIVESTFVRAVYALTLPPYSEVSANVKGQIDTMKLALTPSNMKMEKVEVYKSIGTGDRVSVATTTVPSNNKYSFAMNANSFQKDDEVTYEFMVTGYTLATKDVTLTAKLSIGQSAFTDAGVYTFTTASGRSYKVVHKGSYFYITNTNLTNNTAGTVRFTVDANGKVTDVAVSMGSGQTTQHLIEGVTEAAYQNYLKLNDANEAANAKAITEFQKDYLRKYNVTPDTTGATAAIIAAAIQAQYEKVAAIYGLKDFTDDYERPATDIDYKTPFDADIVEYFELAEKYEFVTYRTYTTHKDLSGTVDAVILSDVKHGFDLGASARYYEDEFYTANTNVDMAKTTFTLMGRTQTMGYMSRKEVYDAYQASKPTPEVTTSFAYLYYKAVTDDWCGVADSWDGNVDYYQNPSTSVGSDLIYKGHDDYDDYIAIYTEILKVLGFEWDSTTKYMYEDKFIELFGANLSTSCPLVWKAYTAELIVPDGTEPPQTGDSASIVGFVMIALAVLAAGAVVIKKVRA